MTETLKAPDHVEASGREAGAGEVPPFEGRPVREAGAVRGAAGGVDLSGREVYSHHLSPSLSRQPEGAAAEAATGVQHAVAGVYRSPFGERPIHVDNGFGVAPGLPPYQKPRCIARAVGLLHSRPEPGNVS